MTQEEQRPTTFDPGNYPALLEFLPAYWHEDFGAEYRSAAQAIAALVSDARGVQIRNVSLEWRALRKALAVQPLHNFQHALAALGAAWFPASEQELREVDEILDRAEA